MRLTFCKWPDVPSKSADLTPLRTDEHGRWFRVDQGTALTPHGDAVLLVPHDGDWIARWPTGGPYELYIDVTTTPVVTADSITAVDLDLDVVRWADGRLTVKDVQQFVDRSAAYPYDVIARARRTADRLLIAVATKIPPFA